MSLPNSVYTTTNGGTVPGSQLDQSNQAMQILAQAGGGNFAQVPDVSKAMPQATAQLAAMQTPQARQQYVTNSNIPAMQTNYNDLAHQLYQMDQTVVGPNYQGVPTTAAPDAVSSSRVAASPLDATVSSLLGSNSFQPTNPGFAISSNTAQKGNILDVLGALNTSIGQEFGARRGEYNSTVGAQRDLVDTYAKILGYKNEADLRKAEIGLQYSRLSQEREMKAAELGYPSWDSLQADLGGGKAGDKGLDSSGNIDEQSLRSAMQNRYNNLPVTSPLRQKLADGWKQSHGTPLFPPAGLSNIVNDIDKSNSLDKTGTLAANLTYWKLTNSPLGIPGSTLIGNGAEKDLANLDSQYFALTQAVMTSIQGSRPSDYDVRSYMQRLGPSIVNKPEVNKERLANMRRLVGLEESGKGSANSSSSSGNTVMTGPDGKQWNVPADKIETFKKNGYK